MWCSSCPSRSIDAHHQSTSTRALLPVCQTTSNYALYLVAEDVIWKEVLAMIDPLPVKYEVIENLFCQRKVKSEKDEPQKKKEPTVVSEPQSEEREG